ncbi:MAG: hypothetical protein DMF53_13425 [Acidobacteria bacterium]|nr:MAG: hypothetical protein DMF53_13425 [Acidobacteriota bacterium]
MIVVPEDSSFLLITQPDHAYLAGEILSLWRADGLPDNPRRDDLLFAAREHDNGWREADAAPRWDAERGRPHDFITLPARERIAVWERGVCRFAAERPYASLLIARHALNLFGGRRGEEEWDRLLDFLTDFENGLIERTGVEPETLEEDYRWLDLADQISLAACAQWREPAGRYGVHIAPSDGAIGIAPFPLAGATTFRVACRRIPRRACRGDADLGGELAAARWEERPVRIVEVSEVSPAR